MRPMSSSSLGEADLTALHEPGGSYTGSRCSRGSTSKFLFLPSAVFIILLHLILVILCLFKSQLLACVQNTLFKRNPFVAFLSAILWNKLRLSLRTCSSLQTYKTKLKKFFFIYLIRIDQSILMLCLYLLWNRHLITWFTYIILWYKCNK